MYKRQGQDGGGQGVGRDVEKNQIHVGLAKLMSGVERLGHGINQAEVDDFDAGTFEPVADDAQIAFESRFQSLELRPVGFKADAEKADAERAFYFGLHLILREWRKRFSRTNDADAIPD